jgi:hypothetical protein
MISSTYSDTVRRQLELVSDLIPPATLLPGDVSTVLVAVALDNAGVEAATEEGAPKENVVGFGFSWLLMPPAVVKVVDEAETDPGVGVDGDGVPKLKPLPVGDVIVVVGVVEVLAGVEPNPKLGLALPVPGAALKPKEELVDELATALVEEVDVTGADPKLNLDPEPPSPLPMEPDDMDPNVFFEACPPKADAVDTSSPFCFSSFLA